MTSISTSIPIRRRVTLFGAQVDALTMEQSLERVFDLVRDRKPSQHVVLNASKVVQMEHDPALKQIITDCDLVNADGISIVLAARLLGTPLPERVTGIDLFLRIVERAADTAHSVFFLGATSEVLNQVIGRFSEQYPTLRIAGAHHGYWSPSEESSVVDHIRTAKPDFLFLAIPSPAKEFWLSEHLSELEVPFVMGVGGSFDVVAGTVKRAPAWVQRVGCEWFYRLAQEPRRLWKRYLIGNCRFLMITARAWVGRWLTFRPA